MRFRHIRKSRGAAYRAAEMGSPEFVIKLVDDTIRRTRWAGAGGGKANAALPHHAAQNDVVRRIDGSIRVVIAGKLWRHGEVEGCVANETLPLEIGGQRWQKSFCCLVARPRVTMAMDDALGSEEA